MNHLAGGEGLATPAQQVMAVGGPGGTPSHSQSPARMSRAGTRATAASRAAVLFKSFVTDARRKAAANVLGDGDTVQTTPSHSPEAAAGDCLSCSPPVHGVAGYLTIRDFQRGLAERGVCRRTLPATLIADLIGAVEVVTCHDFEVWERTYPHMFAAVYRAIRGGQIPAADWERVLSELAAAEDTVESTAFALCVDADGMKHNVTLTLPVHVREVFDRKRLLKRLQREIAPLLPDVPHLRLNDDLQVFSDGAWHPVVTGLQIHPDAQFFCTGGAARPDDLASTLTSLSPTELTRDDDGLRCGVSGSYAHALQQQLYSIDHIAQHGVSTRTGPPSAVPSFISNKSPSPPSPPQRRGASSSDAVSRTLSSGALPLPATNSNLAAPPRVTPPPPADVPRPVWEGMGPRAPPPPPSAPSAVSASPTLASAAAVPAAAPHGSCASTTGAGHRVLLPVTQELQMLASPQHTTHAPQPRAASLERWASVSASTESERDLLPSRQLSHALPPSQISRAASSMNHINHAPSSTALSHTASAARLSHVPQVPSAMQVTPSASHVSSASRGIANGGVASSGTLAPSSPVTGALQASPHTPDATLQSMPRPSRETRTSPAPLHPQDLRITAPPPILSCYVRDGHPQGYRYRKATMYVDGDVLYVYHRAFPLTSVAGLAVYTDPDSQFSKATAPKDWTLSVLTINAGRDVGLCGVEGLSCLVFAAPVHGLQRWQAFLASLLPDVLTVGQVHPLTHPLQPLAAPGHCSGS